MNHTAAAPGNNGNDATLRVLASIAALLLLSFPLTQSASAVKPLDPDAPEATVSAFYTICIGEKISGLPTESQFEKLRPLLSDPLYGLLADARMEQVEFARENPYEKPPWIEGDLFSSLFEGPTRFATANVVITGHRATVTVNFADDEAGMDKPFEWSDDVVLVRNGEGDWVVDDIVYRGTWDFASKGTLTEGLIPSNRDEE